MKPETVECAAVQKDGVVYVVPRPGRHDKAIHLCVSALGIRSIGNHEQGFVTSTGRFVDRGEAARLAYAAGQLMKLDFQPKTLFSEDVW